MEGDVSEDCQHCACVRERDAALAECRKQAALIRKMYSKEFTLLMRYKHALERIHTMAGHPNAVGACISIIAFVERTLGEEKT